MATAKREIYARMATQLRHHERCAKAEKRCPGAMGLYAFLMMQARGEATLGETFDSIAFASWGADTPAMLTYRRKQAEALIFAGLVVREGDDLVVVKYLEHNDGPQEIAAAKSAANLRQDKRRHPEKYATGDGPVTRDTPVTSHPLSQDNPYSISCSLSGSDLESRSRDPDSTPRATPANDAQPVSLVAVPDAMAAPPDWWDAVIDTLESSTGVRLPERATWLSYAGHRASKGRRAERSDALYWLNQVKVPEERERLRREARDRERDAKFDASRARPPGHVEPLTVTPDQAKRDAEALVARIAARKAKGAA